MRTAIAIAAGLSAVVIASPAIPERSDVDVYVGLRPSVWSPAPVAHQRLNARGDIIAMVDAVADRAGLPRAVMHDHVRRESGYRPDARNPRSTAKGLLQVIHGSHEAIVGRRMSRAEHFRLMADPAYALRVGAAHMKACQQLVGNDARRLYACHYHGHARFGGRIEMAAMHFTPDASGWLARGSVAFMSGG
jgi:hypothetical protein